jgi:hypothetical protein
MIRTFRKQYHIFPSVWLKWLNHMRGSCTGLYGGGGSVEVLYLQLMNSTSKYPSYHGINILSHKYYNLDYGIQIAR